MNPLTVLFFGAQGSGKGTQVKQLIDFLSTHSDRKVIHIDMGQELRALRDTGTFVGKLTGAYTDAGKRIPDFMPIYLQTKMLVEQFTGEEHIIADGVARGAEQSDAFDAAVSFFGRDDLQVINLVISDETAIQRALSRGRSDDTEEKIRRRLAWTKTDVVPQLELFRSRGRVIHDIDGEGDVATIHRNVLSVLGLAQ